MLVMAVVTLVGCGIALLSTLLVHHRTSAFCQAATAGIDQEVQDKIKRGKALDTKLAQEILGGCDVDAAIDDFTRSRAAIHTIPTETPWLWDSDHLKKWSDNHLAIQVCALNRKGRLVALSALVAIILAVVAIDSVLYSQLACSPPILSPQPNAKFQPLPTPPPTSPVNVSTSSSSSIP